MLIKVYGENSEGEKRYSPADCVKCIEKKLVGIPDEKHISTSFTERNNWTMRMSMRRVTRLTNGFSKKIVNHGHAIALHFKYYNFGRIHKSLCITPAMAAGVSKHIWSLEEIASFNRSVVKLRHYPQTGRFLNVANTTRKTPAVENQKVVKAEGSVLTAPGGPPPFSQTELRQLGPLSRLPP